MRTSTVVAVVLAAAASSAFAERVNFGPGPVIINPDVLAALRNTGISARDVSSLSKFINSIKSPHTARAVDQLKRIVNTTPHFRIGTTVIPGQHPDLPQNSGAPTPAFNLPGRPLSVTTPNQPQTSNSPSTGFVLPGRPLTVTPVGIPVASRSWSSRKRAPFDLSRFRIGTTVLPPGGLNDLD